MDGERKREDGKKLSGEKEGESPERGMKAGLRWRGAECVGGLNGGAAAALKGLAAAAPKEEED